MAWMTPNGRYYKGARQSNDDIKVQVKPSAFHVWDNENNEWVYSAYKEYEEAKKSIKSEYMDKFIKGFCTTSVVRSNGNIKVDADQRSYMLFSGLARKMARENLTTSTIKGADNNFYEITAVELDTILVDIENYHETILAEKWQKEHMLKVELGLENE